MLFKANVNEKSLSWGGSVLEPFIRMHKDDAANEESTAKSWTLKWRDDELLDELRCTQEA